MGIQQYLRPESVSEAVSMLADGPGVYALAGGTDILVQERSRLKDVSALVDLKSVPGLIGIDWMESKVRIGAATPCAELTADEKLKQLFPGLVEAADSIGSAQIQGRCSLGGNLCNASPAADTTPVLIVDRASVELVGPHGEREIPVTELITGPGMTSLTRGEFMRSIMLPLPDTNRSDAALRLIPRAEMDIAAANAAVSLGLDDRGNCDDLRLAIGAVGPKAVLVENATRALQGRPLDESALSELAEMASAASSPIDDKRGTIAFRRHVVGVLARRATVAAKERVEASR